jgi:poly-beta-1,6-N-acetyl-D-glucosamine synthase
MRTLLSVLVHGKSDQGMRYHGFVSVLQTVFHGLIVISLFSLCFLFPYVTAGVSLLMVLYVYLLYPLLVRCMKQKAEVSVASAEAWPSVSVIISAYNEENCIYQRIHNIMQLDYPKELIEIIVGSDGSIDSTVSIVKNAFPEVNVLDFKTNRGRSSVHNDCAKQASNQILLFTDAESLFTKDFLKKITRPFSDTNVGLTTGVMELLDKDENELTVSRGFYWKFEYWLRDVESQAGLLSVASGCCMAIRRDLYQPLPEITDDIDFICPIDVVLAGYKNRHVPDAVVYESQFTSARGELRSRIRMTARNLAGTLRHLRLAKVQNPKLLWSLWSHKILRWATPCFLITAFVSSLFMLPSPVGLLLFGVQALAYALALLGGLGKVAGIHMGLLGCFYSFFIANLIGSMKAFTGDAASTYHRASEGK